MNFLGHEIYYLTHSANFCKDDKERKRLEQLERKKELTRLHDEEMEAVKGGVKSKASSSAAKVTRHQLDQRREDVEAATGVFFSYILQFTLEHLKCYWSFALP